jgi:hypothetical protein
VQVGMADTARLDGDEHLIRTGIRDVHRDDLDRCTAAASDDAGDPVGNGSALALGWTVTGGDSTRRTARPSRTPDG